jgi:hypothetical protein
MAAVGGGGGVHAWCPTYEEARALQLHISYMAVVGGGHMASKTRVG